MTPWYDESHSIIMGRHELYNLHFSLLCSNIHAFTWESVCYNLSQVKVVQPTLWSTTMGLGVSKMIALAETLLGFIPCHDCGVRSVHTQSVYGGKQSCRSQRRNSKTYMIDICTQVHCSNLSGTIIASSSVSTTPTIKTLTHNIDRLVMDIW